MVSYKVNLAAPAKKTVEASSLFRQLTSQEEPSMDDVWDEIEKGKVFEDLRWNEGLIMAFLYHAFAIHWAGLSGKLLFLLFYSTLMFLFILSEKFRVGQNAKGAPRFNIDANTLRNRASGNSSLYQAFQLVGYPIDTVYPSSASELQLGESWKQGGGSVKSYRDTLVYHLLEAMICGSEFDGETILLEGQACKGELLIQYPLYGLSKDRAPPRYTVRGPGDCSRWKLCCPQEPTA